LITPPHKKYLRGELSGKDIREKRRNIKSKKSKRGGKLLQEKIGIAGRYVTFLNG